ncbi:MAG: hypothetical protein AAFR04_05200 [Pseudomonadota bacterium]
MKHTAVAEGDLKMMSAVEAGLIARQPAAPRQRRRRAEVREFHIMRAVLFVLFLGVAALTRLLPRAWRPLGSSADRSLSVVAEARRAANEVTPYIFMT